LIAGQSSSDESPSSSLLIDGTCSHAVSCRTLGTGIASSSLDGNIGFPIVPITGLSPGTHTVAVRLKTTGGTATTRGGADYYPALIVREHP